jgi:hypothetical protein
MEAHDAWFIKDLDPVTPKAEQPLHHDSADLIICGNQ